MAGDVLVLSPGLLEQADEGTQKAWAETLKKVEKGDIGYIRVGDAKFKLVRASKTK